MIATIPQNGGPGQRQRWLEGNGSRGIFTLGLESRPLRQKRVSRHLCPRKSAAGAEACFPLPDSSGYRMSQRIPDSSTIGS